MDEWRPGEDLALHLVGTHCNAAAIANGQGENQELHEYDHFGPCGLRNHPFWSLAWDEQKIEHVLEEAENE
jgi:hypothetical protein